MSPDPVLAAECEVFTRFLVGSAPPEALVRHYQAAHRVLDLNPATPRDLALLRAARRGPGWTRLSDSVARIFAPRSALRRKLILILSLVEVTGSFRSSYRPGGRSVGVALVSLMGTGVAAALSLFAGLLLVGLPVALRGRGDRR